MEEEDVVAVVVVLLELVVALGILRGFGELCDLVNHRLHAGLVVGPLGQELVDVRVGHVLGAQQVDDLVARNVHQTHITDA